MRRKVCGGFTVLELLVLIGIVALVISIVLPLMHRTRMSGRGSKCSSNLRQIGQGFALYAHDFKQYPRTRWDPTQPCQPGFDNTGFNSGDAGGVNSNNIAAAMFLLVRHTDLNPEVFVCPQSNQEKDTFGGQTVSSRSNFASAGNVGYSIANPYPQEGVEQVKYRWSQNVPADWAIAADRNDGSRDPAVTATSPSVLQKTMNSTNHNGEGQNVLFNDGHVEWAATAWVGANRDNIYTRAKTMQTPEGLTQADPPASDAENFPEPALDMDTVLLPVFPGAVVTPAIAPATKPVVAPATRRVLTPEEAERTEVSWKTPIVLGLLALLLLIAGILAVFRVIEKTTPTPDP